MIKHKYKASYHSCTVLINPDLEVNKFYTDIFSSTVIISNIATLQLLSPRKKKKKEESFSSFLSFFFHLELLLEFSPPFPRGRTAFIP